MMPRIVAALFVTLLAVPVLAGCLGGDDAKPSDDENTCGEQCAIGAKIEEGFGAIRGKVLDDTFNPVKGANVTLREKELMTRTDEQGRFAFNNLEPRAYTVFATKVPTHKPNGRQVDVAAGAPTEADLILELLPPPREPYFMEHPRFDGLIGCSISYAQINTADLCRADTNTKTTFTFQMDAFLTGLMIYLDSQPNLLGQKADLRLDWDVPVKPAINSTIGSTPVEDRHEFSEKNAWPAWGNPDTARFGVRSSNHNPEPQLAYQQKIFIYITTFYNGYPIPDGYSAKQD